MTANKKALAQLDNGRHGAEDEDMDVQIETLRQESAAGIREVNARVDELHRETTARIDALRKETADNFKHLDGKLEQIRKETADHFLAVHAQIRELQRETSLRMDDMRKETSSHIDTLRARMDDMHRETLSHIGNLQRETTVRIDMVIYESQKRMDRSDAQFRWLVALLLSGFLGMFGLLAKSMAVI